MLELRSSSPSLKVNAVFWTRALFFGQPYQACMGAKGQLSFLDNKCYFLDKDHRPILVLCKRVLWFSREPSGATRYVRLRVCRSSAVHPGPQHEFLELGGAPAIDQLAEHVGEVGLWILLLRGPGEATPRSGKHFPAALPAPVGALKAQCPPEAQASNRDN